LKARAAWLHHAAADVDREDNHARGSDSEKFNLDATAAIRQPHPLLRHNRRSRASRSYGRSTMARLLFST
jgi:hypothetical protein